MMLTRDGLLRILPAAGARVDVFLAPLNAAMIEFDINTPARQAGFLAQVGHESGQLRYVEEIASGAAYDNREDLGNKRASAVAIAKANGTTSGRFWKGRGLIQTTGYDNYVAVMLALDIDCVNNPTLLCDPVNACRSAALFWKAHGLNARADTGDFDGTCDVTNLGHKTIKVGDANGYADRLAIFNRATGEFSV